jgi:NhaP-type Na+/H+ and K+/H+ antiporter
MDFVNLPLLAGALLVFLSVLAGLFSTRVGFSFLLVFLCAGLVAGEDGPGGWKFDDFRLSFWVGNLALAVILLDGGLRTSISTFRTGLRPAMLLATVGVVVCAGITALAAAGPGLAYRRSAGRDRGLHRRRGRVRLADTHRHHAERARGRHAGDRVGHQ